MKKDFIIMILLAIIFLSWYNLPGLWFVNFVTQKDGVYKEYFIVVRGTTEEEAYRNFVKCYNQRVKKPFNTAEGYSKAQTKTNNLGRYFIVPVEQLIDNP